MSKTTLILLSILGAILLAVLAVGAAGVSIYNGFVGSEQAVDSQWAQVQNVYQRRADLIPNLVSTVSGAANFEKSTLVEVTEARVSIGKVQINAQNAPTDAAKFAEFEKAQGQLTSALSRLLVVSEKYPELKANANFRDLQAQIEGSENRITVERGRFNQTVQTYNTSVQTFPAVIIAGFTGRHARPYFQAAAGSEAAPKVQFDFNKAAPAKP
jgi:LemA protein